MFGKNNTGNGDERPNGSLVAQPVGDWAENPPRDPRKGSRGQEKLAKT